MALIIERDGRADAVLFEGRRFSHPDQHAAEVHSSRGKGVAACSPFPVNFTPSLRDIYLSLLMIFTQSCDIYPLTNSMVQVIDVVFGNYVID